jgi:cyclohexadienyl dehydratase
MKKVRTLGITAGLLLAAILLVGCSEPEQTAESSGQSSQGQAGSSTLLDEILERGVLRVGTTGDFNPISFRDPDTNERAGFDIELFTKLAEDLEVELEFVATDWRSLVSGVAAGKYDITSNASYNMARAKVAMYTLPVIHYETVPLTLEENAPRFDSWESIDQADVTVATTLGTVFEEQAKAIFENAEFRTVEAPARDFQEVLAGRAEVSITSNVEAATLVQTYPNLVRIDVDRSLYRRGGGLLVARGEQELLNLLNTWITLQEDNGFLPELREKWLGTP